jgi:TetR/AcrR family transcriptional regulator, cholesterol catabolism regulator
MAGTTTDDAGAPARKGDRTRRRLLDAAAAELARHGVAGTSLSAIAATAGLRTGSVYFHFSSKDSLIETVLEEGLRESLTRLGDALAAVPDSADARARLAAAVSAHVAVLVELRDYATVVLSDDLPGSAAASGFGALRAEYLQRWTDLLRDAQESGDLPAGVDPRTLRDVVLGGLNAAVRASGRRGTPPEQVTAAMQALLGL